MTAPVSLLNDLKTRISDPARLAAAAACLEKIASAIAKNQEFEAPSETADLEPLLSALQAALKTRAGAKPELVLRKTKAAERRLLDQAQQQLNLAMRWRDHIRATDTEKGPLIVVEPCALDAQSYLEFAALETAGWRATADTRFAPHFGGHAVCMLLRPPRPQAKPETRKPSVKSK